MTTSQQQEQQQQEQQQQQQEEQQQEAATANPEAPAGSTKSFLAVRREALRANVASSGKRIVCAQAMSLVTTTVLGMLCWWAFWQTESTCTSGPVGLRSWYLGAFVLECLLFMLFFGLMYSVLSVWSNQAVPARLTVEEEADEGGCAVGLGFVLCFVVAFVATWSILGLLAKRDEGGCESGGGYFWYIFTVMWVSTCCCAGGNAADTYRRRHAAQAESARAPQEITV